MILERSRREAESRILVADRIARLPPPTAPSGSPSEPVPAPAKPRETRSNAVVDRAAEESRQVSARSALASAQPASRAAGAPAPAPSRVAVEDLPAPEEAGLVPPARVLSPAPDDQSWAAWTEARGAGVAVIRIDVASDGSVTAAVVVTPEALGGEDALLLDTVRRWRFRPARRDGAEVAGSAMVRLRGSGY